MQVDITNIQANVVGREERLGVQSVLERRLLQRTRIQFPAHHCGHLHASEINKQNNTGSNDYRIFCVKRKVGNPGAKGSSEKWGED